MRHAGVRARPAARSGFLGREAEPSSFLPVLLLLLAAHVLLPGEAIAVPAPSMAGGSAAGTADDGHTGEREIAERAAPDTLLRGRLLVSGEPADSGTVVLHRVTPEEAGPVDSIGVQAGGEFELRLPGPPVPGSGEIFFGSHRREGILYFGYPITDPAQLDSLYLVESFTTRPVPDEGEGIPFPVSVRNLFIDQGPMGWRVTDLIEIRNDSAVTWLPSDGDAPVWRYPLPPEGLSFRLAQGDLEQGALRFAEGGVSLHAPMPPGERLYAIQYEVETLEFTLPLPGATDLLEVMVEEPAPALRMEGLMPERPAELEPGRTYLRWVGLDLVDAEVRVLRGEEGSGEALPWLGLGLALLLFGVGVWAVSRRSGGEPVPARGELVLEVARLDEAFERLPNPSAEEAARYRERRRQLLARLEGADQAEPAPR